MTNQTSPQENKPAGSPGVHHVPKNEIEVHIIPPEKVRERLTAPPEEFKPFMLSFSNGEAAIIAPGI
jgi:hypothetical protein